MKNEDKFKKDITGRDRMLRNVVIGWCSYLVVFISGFLLPRMMDEYIGQVLLGVWDFVWSVVNYLNFIQPGIGASLNRYIAKYRASNRTKELIIMVSTVVTMQIILTLLVLFLVVIFTEILPPLLFDSGNSEIETARWVIGILGSTAAFQMLFSPSKGVLSGCHRWDILNGLQAASSLLGVLLMIGVMIIGRSLIHVAITYFIVQIITALIRVLFSFRVCPELKINLSYASWSQAKIILRFGVKTLTAGVPMLLTALTANVIVASTLGAAALAVFARPISLVRHLQTFTTKFTFVLVPTVGAMQELNQNEELRGFLLKTTKYSVAFTLPIISLLIVFGDVLLKLWMGEQYANWLLMAIIAIGYLLPISQDPIMRILMGLNKHGIAAIKSIIYGVSSFIIIATIVTIWGWSLINAALTVAISLTISRGIVLPMHACRMFEIGFLEYFNGVFKIPLLCAIPYLAILISCRIIIGELEVAAFGLASILGIFILSILYWYFLFTERERVKIRNIIKI